MSNTAIQVSGLSKQYYIGRLKRTSDATIAETIVRTLTGPFRRTARLLRGQQSGAAELDETFWALRDVSFDVQVGEVVGVIGRNGAGKSTLLKLLSRITYPTAGRITLYGRVGSLLEVGTGFHPELTGRENVFLNGGVLGMNRHEIQRKFDEIVDFSGVKQFIDTPVKHYSSGMSVRLAFAVAAHLEPEILLVDEVLAVGDIEFQKKCLGKMSSIASEGRTILFVSHNMGAISNLCERTILLDQGRILSEGATPGIIARYLQQSIVDGARLRVEAGDPKTAVIHEVGILNAQDEATSDLAIDKPFTIWLTYSIYQTISSGQIAISVQTQDVGSEVFVTTHIDLADESALVLHPGTYTARVQIPGHFLNRGGYLTDIRIWGVVGMEGRKCHALTQSLAFYIVDTGSVATRLNDKRGGLIITQFEWVTEKTAE